MKTLNVCVAGLGTVGSNLILTIAKNQSFIASKASLNLNILAISAKHKSKKRNFNISDYVWYDDPLSLIKIKECDVLIELIGEEKGVSFELISKALENKIHVVTANKALLANYGSELFNIAEKNKVQLLYEASVAGGIPIIKTLKNLIFLNKINKISGILNGTTNYILTKMTKNRLNFEEVLKEAQLKGFAESNPANDIDGFDSAHKLTLLSTLCFGSKINFDNNFIEGIADIHIEDIFNAEKLGYVIKLISEASVIDNKISCVTEPKLIKKTNPLANVNGVLNAINIETDQLQTLFLEGEGAGGKATASSIISDLYEIASGSFISPLGYHSLNLKSFKTFDVLKKESSYYLRIMTKDKAGVLSKITTILKESEISIETIFQLPENIKNNIAVSIIISTHKVNKNLLIRAIKKIEKQNFVLNKIVMMSIDKS